jgi:hypothetical protein
LLEDGGIPLTSIDSVIWSHTHFDHIVRPLLLYSQPNLTTFIRGTCPNFPTPLGSYLGRNQTLARTPSSPMQFYKTVILREPAHIFPEPQS